jgi:hypothetical protein
MPDAILEDSECTEFFENGIAGRNCLGRQR